VNTRAAERPGIHKEPVRNERRALGFPQQFERPVPATELADLGFTLIVSPVTALFAMVKEVRAALDLLREKGSLRDDLDRLVTFDGFAEVVDLDRHLALGTTESVAEPGG